MIIQVILCFLFLLSVDTEEAALLHEEATMTIEELLVRYGQNRNAIKHAAAMRYIINVVMIYA